MGSICEKLVNRFRLLAKSSTHEILDDLAQYFTKIAHMIKVVRNIGMAKTVNRSIQ